MLPVAYWSNKLNTLKSWKYVQRDLLEREEEREKKKEEMKETG